ncbi:hypothetical protein [Tateyamaria sp. syn59]|uniref:hypothetical protein n=1 Tax=Tateyamaria sp. syn59 TaxID=2576942 RepID=UPI0011BE621C|nr:hypothetical protein [Tateyamaria sp. syn59]
MKTHDELRALKDELIERRNVELYRLDVHNDDRIKRIANIHITIQAIRDALEEDDSLRQQSSMQRIGR